MKPTQAQIKRACEEARRRVSKMSRAERQALLKRGMAIIYGVHPPVRPVFRKPL